MNTEATAQTIRDSLQRELNTTHLDVEDESWQHQGHAGAASGGGHFSVLVVSEAFRGLSRVQRHQLVYRAVGKLMDDIHALAIRALPPEEWNES